MRVTFDAKDLLRFVRRFDGIRHDIDSIIVVALNEAGDSIARQTTRIVSEETGLTVEQASRFVRADRASSGSHQYVVHVMHGMIERERISREMPRRTFPGGRDMPDMLVNILTAGDDNVCPICERLAEEGPYSPDELNRLKAEHPHFLNSTQHCRCVLLPYQPRGKVRARVSYQSGGLKRIDMGQTIHQLSARVSREVKTVLKVRK